jgi:hypothetical protein
MAIIDKRLENGARITLEDHGIVYLSEGEGTVLIYGDADLEAVRVVIDAAIAIRKAQS